MTPWLKFIHWIAIYTADKYFSFSEQPGTDPKSATQADTVLKKRFQQLLRFGTSS